MQVDFVEESNTFYVNAVSAEDETLLKRLLSEKREVRLVILTDNGDVEGKWDEHEILAGVPA